MSVDGLRMSDHSDAHQGHPLMDAPKPCSNNAPHIALRARLLSVRSHPVDKGFFMSMSPNRDSLPNVRDSESVASADLLRWLGAPVGPARSSPRWSRWEASATRVELAPGELLCAQGGAADLVGVVESGLLQCHIHQQGLGLPGTVSHAGAREWIGLNEQAGRRRETIRALVRTTLITLPASEVRELSASSPLVAQWLSRQASLALKRDWRLAYSLRDLSPEGRIVSGLLHLLRLIDPLLEEGSPDRDVSVDLDLSVLSTWLGLNLNELQQHLKALERDGALRCDAGHIVSLSPGALFRASRSVKQVSRFPLRPPLHSESDSSDPGCVWEDAP